MHRQRWLAVGASTGGPGALLELLGALAPRPAVRVVVVQHIAPGFDGGLATWLADFTHRDVRIAVDGERPPLGSVRIAPAGSHLVVSATERLRLDAVTPPRSGHRPAVDELFFSLARVAPSRTVAVLLSGMGYDGASGQLALRRCGALCLVQDEESSTVFGMARAALELGACDVALPPAALGARIERWLSLPLTSTF